MSCERDVKKAALRPEPVKAAEPGPESNRPRYGRMSGQQRALFRIRETTAHLDQVLEILKKSAKTVV